MNSPVKSYRNTFLILGFALIVVAFINISLGSVAIPLKFIFEFFFNKTHTHEAWQTILINYRYPKAITAILVGSGLSVSGLLMQTLFRNPLAGP
ncbi:MAG: iron chelate uptake ABC transporter family permease subunit, partial [Lutibacter sp.]